MFMDTLIMDANDALRLTREAFVREKPRIASLVDAALIQIGERAKAGYRSARDPVIGFDVDGPILTAAYALLEAKGFKIFLGLGRPDETYRLVIW